MKNLWFLLAFEPLLVNSLSLLKAEGEIETTVGLEPDREVNFVDFLIINRKNHLNLSLSFAPLVYDFSVFSVF